MWVETLGLYSSSNFFTTLRRGFSQTSPQLSLSLLANTAAFSKKCADYEFGRPRAKKPVFIGSQYCHNPPPPPSSQPLLAPASGKAAASQKQLPLFSAIIGTLTGLSLQELPWTRLTSRLYTSRRRRVNKDVGRQGLLMGTPRTRRRHVVSTTEACKSAECW